MPELQRVQFLLLPPVVADWPITRQKRPHTLIQEESFWQVEPGAAFAHQNIRQQNNSYLCGKVLNVTALLLYIITQQKGTHLRWAILRFTLIQVAAVLPLRIISDLIDQLPGRGGQHSPGPGCKWHHHHPSPIATCLTDWHLDCGHI